MRLWLLYCSRRLWSAISIRTVSNSVCAFVVALVVSGLLSLFIPSQTLFVPSSLLLLSLFLPSSSLFVLSPSQVQHLCLQYHSDTVRWFFKHYFGIGDWYYCGLVVLMIVSLFWFLGLWCFLLCIIDFFSFFIFSTFFKISAGRRGTGMGRKSSSRRGSRAGAGRLPFLLFLHPSFSFFSHHIWSIYTSFSFGHVSLFRPPELLVTYV